jgi:hypothetical protein
LASSVAPANGGTPPSKLFDAPATPSSIGTSFSSQQFAASGTGFGSQDNDFNPVLSFTFAAPITANAIVFSGRGSPILTGDTITEMKIWFTSSPFVPSLGSSSGGNAALDPVPASPPDEILTGFTQDMNFNEYTFSSGAHASQYVTIQMIGLIQNAADAPIEYGQQSANPGGFELRFADDSSVPSIATPLPSSVWGGSALLAIVGMGVLIRRRRKHRRVCEFRA